MDAPIFNITKFHEVTWTCGLPINEPDYSRSILSGEFANSVGTWKQYQKKCVNPYKAFLEPLVVNGASNIMFNTGIKDLQKVLCKEQIAKNNTKAVVFLSHFNRDTGCIELSDGMVPFKTIIDIIPETFVGVIDISACSAKEFAIALKKKCPRAQIKYFNIEISFGVWMEFWGYFLSELIIQGCDKSQAQSSYIELQLKGLKVLKRMIEIETM